MAFTRYSGKPNIKAWPKIANIAFEVGDLVYPDGAGAVKLADSTSGNHIGVCQQKIQSSDSDFSETTDILIDECQDDDEFLVDVGTGTLTTAMIGTYRDLKDENSLDVAQSKLVVFITDFVSSSKAVVKINAMAANVNVAVT